MPEKVEKDSILALLAKADTKWYKSHSDGFNYREHLEFTAEYIAKHYKNEAKKQYLDIVNKQ